MVEKDLFGFIENFDKPTFAIENNLNGSVAGIDEAGRGPLCGPVFASCVLLNRNVFPKNLNDSKKIKEKERENIFEEIVNFEKRGLLFYGIASVSAEIIDRINIREATKLAMKNAYENLVEKYGEIVGFSVNNVIVDGNFVPSIDVNAISVVKGDQKSLSIACASIVAKVSRDRELVAMDKLYPVYGWVKNKGYGTKEHIEAIKKFGLVNGYHRKSFCKSFV